MRKYESSFSAGHLTVEPMDRVAESAAGSEMVYCVTQLESGEALFRRTKKI